MGRRAKPEKVKAKAKRPPVRKAPKKDAARVHGLEKRLNEALGQIAETREQQTATSEILRVISNSPTDLQPVFDAIAERAMQLCGASSSGVLRFDGELVHIVALGNVNPDGAAALRSAFPMAPNPRSASTRAILTRSIVHIPDILDDPEYGIATQAQAGGFRSVLSVPMLREGKAIGGVTVGRSSSGRFSESQIALLKTFADQAVIAIENVRLFHETKEALEQQTATSEILRVISSSPTDVQPVFDVIVEQACRLCDAMFANAVGIDGDLMHNMAAFGFTPEAQAVIRRSFPMRPSRATMSGRAILERAVVVSEDASIDTVGMTSQEISRSLGGRAMVSVPMLRDGIAVGAITLARRERGRFPERQVNLLRSFAHQAVIAIENVRLFKELEARNGQLSEALEQQTATSEILSAISSSPTDIQPVFSALATSAARLCDAFDAAIHRIDGDVLRLAAHEGPIQPDAVLPLTQGTLAGHVVRERLAMQVPDMQTEADVYPVSSEFARTRGFRTILAVPLLRGAEVLGTITIRRTEVRPFTDRQAELLKTFADQAVIAIENVRLFKELEARNRDLTTALDRQTATAEILRVISSSPTDVQPVFDAILRSAVKLCNGLFGITVLRDEGDMVQVVAVQHPRPDEVAAVYPAPLTSSLPPCRSIRENTVVHVPDVEAVGALPPEGLQLARAAAVRSVLVVPMRRQGNAVGAILMARPARGPFPEEQIELLKTFADQAVIAIENARLFSELQARTAELTRSVGELRALGEVGQAISSTLDLQTVLSTIVARATQLAGADAGVIYEYDEQREVFEPRATERLEDDIVQTLVAKPVRKGQGATGRLAEVREPIQLADLRALGEQIPVRDSLIRAGYRALLAVPLVREDHLIGGLTVFRKTPGAFAAEIVDVLKTFATQSSLAIQNARLFREIAQKSRELEVASQHKSEFLASMSHELRTPLNAIIGFSDVLLQGMFGEMGEKQTEYLQDILASGQHLLSLINDILDLSKIEAGRMDLDLAAFHLPAAIDDALLLMRERAGRRGITLERHVDERLGEISADQRKVKQVLLNLLSNAVKFTPEGGRIDVRAGLANGTAEISVTDTGIGIAPEDHDAVFEEFRQVGKADKKAEGTGLGLALCRKLVELHGGRIWVKSQIGAGSTFTFTLPLSQRSRDGAS